MLIHRCMVAFAIALVGALTSAACTNARLGDRDDEGNGSAADAGGEVGDQPDAGPGGGQPEPDAGGGQPEQDAAPELAPITLSHSNSLDIVGDNSVACGPNDFTVSAQSYYRVFDLTALGLTGPLHIEKVKIGIQQSTSSDGKGHQADVALYTLDGELQLDNLTNLTRTTITVRELAPDDPGDVGGLLRDVAIEATVPAGAVLVVELSHGDLPEGDSLLIGSNQAAQTGPTFTRAAFCGDDEPIDTDDIEVGGDQVLMHWVLQVDGLTGG